MTYTESMLASIANVDAGRSARMSTPFRRMTPEERDDVLRRFHPDYIEQAMREIRMGRSQGERTPLEMADVLEGPAQITPASFQVGAPDLVCDVLVIGGGGAGASAALLASENGAQVVLATKLRFGDANTMMAQGGIQAADKPDDFPAMHYLDVVGGGHFSNVPDLVEALVSDAPSAIRWLEELGVMFDKLPDGTMSTVHGGGTSRKRMHSARDYSGAEIMRVLRDEVRCRSDRIQVVEFNPVVELLTDGTGRVTGAVLLDLETREYRVVGAKAIVLATGGGGRLHYQGFPTTNHYGATGDGVVLAYRAGAKLAFMHTMQYHPTGAAYPEQILGQLVTEKVRGLGAQVCNVHGEQFVYPLETRDVEFRRLHSRMRRPRQRRWNQHWPARRLAGFPDDRPDPRTRDDREGSAGDGAPVSQLQHRHDPSADPGLSDAALPERRRGARSGRLDRRGRAVCRWRGVRRRAR